MSDTCNWCDHPKRKHDKGKPSAGCLTLVNGSEWLDYCQCTASRGVVRKSPKRKEKA